MSARDELLAAVIAERLDCRWFPTPPKPPVTAADITVARDDEVVCARRRRAALKDDESVHRRGGHMWTSDYQSSVMAAQTRDSKGDSMSTKALRLTVKVADSWENGSGPAGARTPVAPGLDQHPCLRGSASRG